MSRYKCLSCEHEFEAKKDERELSKPRQCSKCWSWFVIPLEEYAKAKTKTLELIETTPLGIIPLWDVVQAIFLERGIQLTPRFTLQLCDRIYQDIRREKGI